MSKEDVDNDLEMGLSTYGLITIERLLEYYSIRLAHDDLLTALRTPDTFYHQLIRLPLRNVFNGIILQQTRDYQLYVQKIYIDYLISGESGKEADVPGAGVREDIENERNNVIALSEQFHALELKQNKLIADSQALLVKHAKDWNAALQQVIKNSSANLQKTGMDLSKDKIAKIIFSLLVQYNLQYQPETTQLDWKKAETLASKAVPQEVKEIFTNAIMELQSFNSTSNAEMGDYDVQISEMAAEVKGFRSQFQQAIVRANTLIKQLPDYHVDEAQNQANREDLNFDPEL